MSTKLILASSSRYRRALLERLKLTFEWISPDIDESPLPSETPSELVKRLSIAKAKAVSRDNNNHWVIGSDQVAVIKEPQRNQQSILGKPLTKANAIAQLNNCSGKEMHFITGIALINRFNQQELYAESIVKVQMLELSEQQIANYLAIDNPFDCAGSFKIESLGIALFRWVKSDDPTSLEGLPLISLTKLLRQAGIDPLINN